VLAVTMPVDGSYNPDRPNMLLPVTLSPITQVAKAIEADSKTAVLVLGHGDSSGAAAANQKLSLERAASVSAIFRLSGLQRDRLMLKGMGSVMPRAANDSAQGRALNRRVEMLLTPRTPWSPCWPSTSRQRLRQPQRRWLRCRMPRHRQPRPQPPNRPPSLQRKTSCQGQGSGQGHAAAKKPLRPNLPPRKPAPTRK
jgi:hypothetical protein